MSVTKRGTLYTIPLSISQANHARNALAKQVCVLARFSLIQAILDLWQAIRLVSPTNQ